MNKILSVFFFLGYFLLSQNSYAQLQPAWSLGAAIGGAKGISVSTVSSLSAEYRANLLWHNGIAPDWSLEFGIGSVKISSVNEGGYSNYAANILPIDFRVRFAPLESEKLEPYIFAGVGFFHYTISSTPAPKISPSGTTVFFPAGIGLSYSLGKQWAADCSSGINSTLSDALNPIPDKGIDSYWSFSMGISFTFGESSTSHSDEFDFGSRGNVIIMREVYFENGKASIRRESERQLNKILNGLTDQPEIEIEFRSYTDNSPDFITSMTLTAERAEAMKVWFVSRGIAASRISTQGYGSHNPLVPNDTPENRAKNERTEMVRMK